MENLDFGWFLRDLNTPPVFYECRGCGATNGLRCRVSAPGAVPASVLECPFISGGQALRFPTLSGSLRPNRAAFTTGINSGILSSGRGVLMALHVTING